MTCRAGHLHHREQAHAIPPRWTRPRKSAAWMDLYPTKAARSWEGHLAIGCGFASHGVPAYRARRAYREIAGCQFGY